ncbi:MAG: substrate-binding domain-containing protein [Acidobacteria bacterium]|nr:substrate-binding domain-containing protein [Acidobacteriota bacterium]MBI3280606.1 substrate-binding domain-containing protein [Acidobacteriota bacterium]
MKRRRFVLGLAGGVLSGLLAAACNRGRKRVIAVIPKGRAHLFWQSVHAGAAKAAQETGVEIIWNGPATETDFNGQLQIVEAMINRRVDAIALAPIDKKAMVNVVERAAREKIPVVIFDSAVDTEQFASQVATDNYEAGRVAAERLGRITGGKGNVAIVAVQVGAASTMAREAGFEDTIKTAYPGIRIVDKRYGEADFAKSLRAAENILTAYPDLAAMFASNESSTVGAVQALKARRSSVKLVGFDSGPTLEADLRAGIIDSLVVQHPFKMGYESVIAAVKTIHGEKVQKINNMAPRLIVREDLDKPDVQAQLNPDLKKYLN